MVREASEGAGLTSFERIDYVILYVRDLDRSISFYRDVIGLP
ncbi:MAG TPA: VOC family protein, partial [Actinomycetota bacterium]|nr:VOC family protein [Actinomycetota bacterium]